MKMIIVIIRVQFILLFLALPACHVVSLVLMYSYLPAFRYIPIHSLVFSLQGRAWQELELSHVTVMTLAHCILGKFLGVVYHCFPQPLDVSTLAARCFRPQRRERS